MIPKGNQRAGGQQLATHLLNAYDNDSVEVVDMRGAIAQDLHGAFAEWYAEAKATKCIKYLYSLSINPDHTQGPFNREHYYDFIRRTEDKLGLSGQPRAVVFHVKHGREHYHVVWSRIDTEKMKAVQLSHDHQKLRAVAQEYARDHNIKLPPGMQNDRGKDRYADRDKQENLGDKQREERTGVSKPQRRREISEAWHASDTGPAFIKALEEKCYYVARGDDCALCRRGSVRRGFQSRATNRRRENQGTRSPPRRPTRSSSMLPPRRSAPVRSGRPAFSKHAASGAKQKRTAQERREALQQAHAVRRGNLEEKRQQLAAVHGGERKALAELQIARSAAVLQERAARQPTGVLAFLARITGFNALTAFRHAREDKQRIAEQRQQTAALIRRHRREMQNFRHQESALGSLDKRERRSLETELRREALQRLARPDRTIQPEFTAAATGKTEIRKGDDERKEKLKRTSRRRPKERKRPKRAAGKARGKPPLPSRKPRSRP